MDRTGIDVSDWSGPDLTRQRPGDQIRSDAVRSDGRGRLIGPRHRRESEGAVLGRLDAP